MTGLEAYFRSIVEQDDQPVVICDVADTILYMNPAAEEMFADDSGRNLIGRSILDCHPMGAKGKIRKVVDWFSESSGNNMVHTMYRENGCRDVYMVALRSPDGGLIGYYEKHVPRKRDETPFYSMRSTETD